MEPPVSRSKGGNAYVGGHGSSRTAAGPPGDSIEVPGISGDLKSGVLCRGPHGELIHIEFAQNDGIPLFQSSDNRPIIEGDIPFEDLRSTGRLNSLGAEDIFKAYRNPARSPISSPSGDLVVHPVRLLECLFFCQNEIGSDLTVNLFDPLGRGPRSSPWR